MTHVQQWCQANFYILCDADALTETERFASACCIVKFRNLPRNCIMNGRSIEGGSCRHHSALLTVVVGTDTSASGGFAWATFSAVSRFQRCSCQAWGEQPGRPWGLLWPEEPALLRTKYDCSADLRKQRACHRRHELI